MMDRTTELLAKIELVELATLEADYDEMTPEDVVVGLDIIERVIRIRRLYIEDHA